MFREAIKNKLQFNTAVGVLLVHQLFDLTKEQLDTLAVSLQKEYKESDKKSFLSKRNKKDKEIKLKLDIVLDILYEKVEEEQKANDKILLKQKEQELLEIIKEKENEELKNSSIEELKKELKNLKKELNNK